MGQQRQPVKSLHPLTQKQQNYLESRGLAESENLKEPWWVRYFDASAEEYKNPYASVGEPVVFDRFVRRLKEDMAEARRDRSQWRKMSENNLFPPDLSRTDPFKLPEYLFWWQAENAFRRGYMEGADDSFYATVKDAIRDVVKRNRNVLTVSAMQDLSVDFAEDPVTYAFFIRMSEDPPEALGLSKIVDILTAERDRAYQQFSPFFQPLRSVTGKGFFGLGGRR